jgi:hypothetical protein
MMRAWPYGERLCGDANANAIVCERVRVIVVLSATAKPKPRQWQVPVRRKLWKGEVRIALEKHKRKKTHCSLIVRPQTAIANDFYAHATTQNTPVVEPPLSSSLGGDDTVTSSEEEKKAVRLAMVKESI